MRAYTIHNCLLTTNNVTIFFLGYPQVIYIYIYINRIGLFISERNFFFIESNVSFLHVF